MTELLALLLALLMLNPQTARRSEDPLRELVQRVAKGDDADADDATEELIEAVVSPLAGAIGSLESRPASEVVRLRGALAQLGAALRMKLVRVDLPEDDRKLFDEFVKTYPELSRRLFNDQYRTREMALQQIPLDRDSGSGVMIALRVDDEEESVAFAALKLARKLKDGVVARGLSRYVHAVTEAVESGFYGPAAGEIKLTLSLLVLGAMEAVVDAGFAEATPVMARAFRTFAAPLADRWPAGSCAQAAMLLGRFSDERASAALASMIEDIRPAETRSAGAGSMLVQTVGDAALLGLCSLYQIKAESLGMAQVGAPPTWGFLDDATRKLAQRQMKLWLEQNGSKPRESRDAFKPVAAATTKPTTKPAEEQPRIVPQP